MLQTVYVPAGVEWLCAGVVVSTSIDQRLNVWRVGPPSLTLCSSLTHDVADVAALKVHSSRYASVYSREKLRVSRV